MATSVAAWAIMDLTAQSDSIKQSDRQAGVEVTDAMVEAACDVLEESGLLEWGVNPNPVTVRRMIESALRVASAKTAEGTLPNRQNPPL